MKRLETYVNEYSSNNEEIAEISESTNFSDYDPNDGIFAKIFKSIIRWFKGETKEKEYNPYDSKYYNYDAVETKLNEWKKSSGTKTAEVESKELKESEFKALLKKDVLPFFKTDMEDNKKLYDNNSYKALVVKKIDDVCKNLPVVFYSFNKGLNKNKYLYIVNIEGIYPYANVVSPKDVMKSIKEDMKAVGAKAVKIRFISKNKEYGFEEFLNAVEKSNGFERDNSSEKNSNEKVYVTINKKKN